LSLTCLNRLIFSWLLLIHYRGIEVGKVENITKTADVHSNPADPLKKRAGRNRRDRLIFADLHRFRVTTFFTGYDVGFPDTSHAQTAGFFYLRNSSRCNQLSISVRPESTQ
jgi:hypothetical protein